MDVCQVVRQLKTLASDAGNRETIVKDQGCLPGLVLFLDNDNDEVVHLALETLKLLSECAANRPVMRDELGMVVSLEAIINRSHYNSRAQKLAKDLHHTLTSHPLKESQRNRTKGKTPSKACKGTRQYQIGGKRKGKNIILQIEGFTDKSCRKACEDELLQIKGVFSFTFDVHKKRFNLRTKLELQPEVLVAAIANTKTMTAEQIVKNEYGEEVVLSFGANPAAANKENDSLPDYLPEDASPIKGLDKAMTIHGKEQDEGRGWLRSAATFISTSFYW
ncbi:armadillo repeat-containing protein 1-like [Amphiura filiformis]|uniref:armadillo repeat-containing protein 1-like n=1 Tax=Amphiura filiformis TaxID=82378 RepID=UPI003B21952C